MPVVIVESPSKAKTINGYLGSKYEVFASFGHVRDLPAKDGSVRPDEDFAMSWEVDDKANKRLSEIAKAVKNTDKLILATDPDREGEAISWHVLDVLRQKKVLGDIPIERVVFNAITKDAVRKAMEHPRAIDTALVDAYLARRALDYLVGFTLSPVLWRKLPGARSAGRVQSVSLRLVVDRELEIEAFKTREYWSIEANLGTPRNDTFMARLVGSNGKKIDRLDIGSMEEADKLRRMLDGATYKVETIEAKPVKRHPSPPFTTSTLQQEASRKLGLSPARTMQIAQKLYEGTTIGGETVGLITYMRTDGIDLAPEAITGARRVIAEKYGERYVPNAPRVYKNKAKNAQEAHEAVRPTDLSRTPDQVRRYVEPEHAKLYELIWIRTMASQMESAELERTTAEIVAINGSDKAQLRATGSVVTFDGFLTLYQEGEDDAGDGDDKRLPQIIANDTLKKNSIEAHQHFTEPPPRYTEASLVKRMEELGIGRPSTYASILAVLQERGYVRLDKKRLYPDDKGRIVTAFLTNFFARYVQYDFTANLEEQLDLISAGEQDWKIVLREFWEAFSNHVASTKELRITQVIDTLNEAMAARLFPPRSDGKDARLCPNCNEGQLSLKLGKYGSFIGCSNYPECKFTRQMSGDNQNGETDAAAASGGKLLGKDPNTDEDITLREGRFGPYVQLGEGKTPKRSGLPKGMERDKVDLGMALKLLQLPREVGKHPESGEPISANLGRYGPYIQHQKTYVTLPNYEDVFDIGINRAVDMIAEKIANPRSGRFKNAAPAGRALGDHPELGGKVEARDGRFGPYVSHDGVNATLPRDMAPGDITLTQAVELIDARRASGATGKSKKSRAKPKAAAKTKAAAKSKVSGKPKAAPKAKTAPKKKIAAGE